MKNITFKIVILCWKMSPFKKTLRTFINLEIFKGIKKKLYKDLRYKGVFLVKQDEISFEIYNSGYATIENEIFWFGIDNGWEQMTSKVWKKLSKNSEQILDIGANTGIFSLLACAVNPSAQVYSYEPVIRTSNIFKKNITLNKSFNIKLITKAVSNKVGFFTIYDFDTLSQYSASLNPNIINDNKKIEYQVDTCTIDSELYEKIDLVKIDVELHEFEVLQGMKKIIKSFKPTMIIEILTDELREKVFNFLIEFKYQIFNINSTDNCLSTDYEITHENRNFLFIQKEKTKYIQEFIN